MSRDNRFQTTGGRNGGRGRASGRDGRHGRNGGRGQENGRGSNGGARYSHKGYLFNNGGYPGDVWNSFKPEEKAYVNKLHDDQTSKKNASSIGTQNDDKRQRTSDDESTR